MASQRFGVALSAGVMAAWVLIIETVWDRTQRSDEGAHAWSGSTLRERCKRVCIGAGKGRSLPGIAEVSGSCFGRLSSISHPGVFLCHFYACYFFPCVCLGVCLAAWAYKGVGSPFLLYGYLNLDTHRILKLLFLFHCLGSRPTTRYCRRLHTRAVNASEGKPRRQRSLKDSEGCRAGRSVDRPSALEMPAFFDMKMLEKGTPGTGREWGPSWGGGFRRWDAGGCKPVWTLMPGMEGEQYDVARIGYPVWAAALGRYDVVCPRQSALLRTVGVRDARRCGPIG